MTIKNLQKEVKEVFEEHFGYTPLTERLSDIEGELDELKRYTDVPSLRKELGDLLASSIQMANENEWDVETLVLETLAKIKTRGMQYKSLGRKYNVALLGGAFDMPTMGHIQLAKFVLDTSRHFDEVWLTPANKHMFNKSMTSAEHRLNMCNLATECDKRIKVFDYEISHDLGGETYYLFKKLLSDKELDKRFRFSMIIGMDNANSYLRWFNFNQLERIARFVVVSRQGIEPDPKVTWYKHDPHIYLKDENDIILNTSSTFVKMLLRKLRSNENIKETQRLLDIHLDKNVLKYIINNSLYL